MVSMLFYPAILLAATAQVPAGQDGSPAAIPATTTQDAAAANNAAAQSIAAREQAQSAASDASQAQYDADMRAYEEARQVRRETIHHDQSYYDREQRAYAAAMADWRMQVEACHHGHTRACNAPAPRPGDYM